jgi:hypothetical protein
MSQVRLERYSIDHITKFEKETGEEVISGARACGLNIEEVRFRLRV